MNNSAGPQGYMGDHGDQGCQGDTGPTGLGPLPPPYKILYADDLTSIYQLGDTIYRRTEGSNIIFHIGIIIEGDGKKDYVGPIPEYTIKQLEDHPDYEIDDRLARNCNKPLPVSEYVSRYLAGLKLVKAATANKKK